jgi:hypothetical protein
MTPHLSSRPDVSQALAPASPYAILAVFSLVLAFSPALMGMELSDRADSSEATPVVERVNRTGKADRLQPVFGRGIGNPPIGPGASDHRLVHGCEPLVSSLVLSPLARIPGRCLS